MKTMHGFKRSQTLKGSQLDFASPSPSQSPRNFKREAALRRMQTRRSPGFDNIRLEEENNQLEERLERMENDFDALKQYAEHCTEEVERLTLKSRRLEEQVKQV